MAENGEFYMSGEDESTIEGSIEAVIYSNEENGYSEIAIFKEGVTL